MKICFNFNMLQGMHEAEEKSQNSGRKIDNAVENDDGWTVVSRKR